jgi:aromatic ring-opening dioxygenase LigB subunit
MQGCVCPHPPILIPEIGRASRQAISATVNAMERLAEALGDHHTLVIISPHTPGYVDAHTVKTAPRLRGDFAAFGCPDAGSELANDVEFADALLAAAHEQGVVVIEPEPSPVLDHGVLVPMHFLRAGSLVSLSVAGAYDQHRILGQLVRGCADDLGRDVAFVASADLSHRLTPSAPAGYDAQGSVFDRRVVQLLSEGDFAGLTGLDDKLVQAAGQCGLRSLVALGGFLGDEAVRDPQIFSYEGPFGVGYLVAGFGLTEAV